MEESQVPSSRFRNSIVEMSPKKSEKEKGIIKGPKNSNSIYISN